MNRKFTSEIGINMMSGWVCITQQDQLNKLSRQFDGDIPDFHIYAVTRRPKITIREDTIKVAGHKVTFDFEVHQKNKRTALPLSILFSQDSESIQARSPYPHSTIEITDQNGDLICGGPVSLILQTYLKAYPDFLDLEVLYVGQAFGSDGERIAPDRLLSHSTLQSIYFDSINKWPDYDIWLALLQFQETHIFTFDGRSPSNVSDEEDDAHRRRVIDTPISKAQKINFTEAALIKYFQPIYNIKFKDEFPTQKHQSYSECYNLEINGVMFELKTDTIKCRLFSESIPANFFHLGKYPLYSKEDRKFMLDI